ncbi:MAG: calcium:proton antiporter [Actinomycetota bacterium]
MAGREIPTRRRVWHVAVPIVAVIVLALTWNRELPTLTLVLTSLVLALAILSAVHHAEVVAAKVGEPFGSLTLAVAVTIIEVALIVTLMTSDPLGTQTLARDTIFAALMITCNGIVGIALITRTLRGGEATFNAAGAVSGLSAIAAISTFCLILPTFTTSTAGPTLNTTQLAFAALAALTVYLVFVLVQTVRHRDYFLPDADEATPTPLPESVHVVPPTGRTALGSLILLVIALVAVVGLAKVSSPLIEAGLVNVGLPSAAVAVSIALLVLLPESIAAVRAARRNRIQTSLNLAYGSAMASIGLTIPTIAVISWLFDYQLILGLDATAIVLLAATLFTGLATVLAGRATVLQGSIHLSLLAGFLVLVAAP